MSEQSIEVTVEAIAETLRKLTDATDGIEDFRSLSTAGGPQTEASATFNVKLDAAIVDFNRRTTAMTKQLVRLRQAIQATGEDFVAHDVESGQVQTQLTSQLDAANTSTPPAPTRPINAGMR